jgi:guanosine-3',5'-bis(diphosphate) 3'-pyrophosphohydrolase
MESNAHYSEEEKKDISKAYRQLMSLVKPRLKPGDDKRIRLAFELAVDAHKEQRRKSGEPYIFHPIAVAQIAAEEISLGATSIIAALLHDTVEDTDLTLDIIKKEFGETTAKIISGLTKISQISHQTDSVQAENFRKILLTLSDDIRVILIKIADRLHNMRTLDAMPRKNQLKIASETIYLYAPLAHRLGLYTIKGELEDLAMKYTESEKYKEIARLLNDTKRERNKFIAEFIKPLQEDLEKNGFKAQVFGRPKSISSIWHKMRKKEIPFEEVYDQFAIRVIIDTTPDKEKEDCWRAYSIITDKYSPDQRRLRDWITFPKGNGYESLHTTVMSPKGKWVEVQIRTQRMDIIAEKGVAAHFKYKENKNTQEDLFENWLLQIREFLKTSAENSVEFVDNFKHEFISKEIYTFTPTGEMRMLPVGASALDFAYDIHTKVGDNCIGAKVNGKLVSISYVLQNGDQIEIITSKKQKPTEDWLNFATTSRAKNKIKNSLREEKRVVSEVGKEILERKLKQLKINFNNDNIGVLLTLYKVPSALDLYFEIAKESLDLNLIKTIKNIGGTIEIPKYERKHTEEYVPQTEISKNTELIIFGENSKHIPYEFAQCCNPIQGDEVVGFLSVNGMIKIHRTGCKNVINLMSKYGYRIVKTSWTQQKKPCFLIYNSYQRTR